jgi:carotenoid biosynthesis protein
VILPPAVYELGAAPVAFVLAAVHARRALGTARAALELVSLVAYGYALERTAIAVFGSHVYGPTWRLAPGGVPVAVAATWAAVIVSAMAVGARTARSPLGRAAAAALVGISLDLLMEPVAVRAGLWAWTPPGPWLDVPIGNFVGWAVIVGTYTYGAERWGGTGALGGQVLHRLCLGAGAVAALLAVGVAWIGLGAERLFHGAGGWVAWGLVLAAAVAGRGREAGPKGDDPGLAGRLAVPGPLPALVLLILATTFATDALATRDARLVVVALGAIAALAMRLRRPTT